MELAAVDGDAELSGLKDGVHLRMNGSRAVDFARRERCDGLGILHVGEGNDVPDVCLLYTI